ncbi:MAG: DUF4157 domain-containing protein [Chitinophagaceae bacterium]|nr:DUF4157 domain-containing protein [Chitinophagaceae bacterium]MBK8952034.1 DUF4157 domain-containing protein [Chitinophagaceae bacterium]
MKVSIKENAWVAKLAAAKLKSAKVAIVFGSTIYLHNTSRDEFLNDKKWVLHELKHVEQYQRHGFAGFLFRYVWEWIKRGYYNNRFEEEARNNEKEENQLSGVLFI